MITAIVLATLACGVAFGYALASLRSHMRAIRQQIHDLAGKVDKLSESQRTRNPYRTNDGLEDAIAVALDVLQQSRAEREYEDYRINQLRAILGQIRTDPDGYDSDQPNRKVARNGFN